MHGFGNQPSPHSACQSVLFSHEVLGFNALLMQSQCHIRLWSSVLTNSTYSSSTTALPGYSTECRCTIQRHFHCIHQSLIWLRTRVANIELAPLNLRILLKCVSGAAEISRISKFSVIPIAYLLLYFVQFPVLDFGLGHSGSQLG